MVLDRQGGRPLVPVLEPLKASTPAILAGASLIPSLSLLAPLEPLLSPWSPLPVVAWDGPAIGTIVWTCSSGKLSRRPADI